MDIIIGAVIGFTILISAVVVAPTVKMAMNIAPFLYTNTRCSGKSGLILKKKQYDSLLGAAYLKEVYAELENTAYSHVAEHSNQFGYSSEMLDKDLFATYKWVEELVPDTVRPIIRQMRAKLAILELKQMMNSLNDGKEVGDLHFIQEPNVRLKLEEATDMNSFAMALEGTQYADIVMGGDATTQLDRQYLLDVMDAIESCKDEKASEPFKDYWSQVIDLANIRLTLRKIKEENEIKLVPGGHISLDKLEGLNDVNQLTEALKETPYEEFDLTAGGMELEHQFLVSIERESARVSAKHPLTTGPIVRFIVQKELEVRNLNIVLKLKAEKFKAEEIEKLLVIGA